MMQDRPILISNGRLLTINLGENEERRADILIVEGKIVEIADSIEHQDADVIDADGMIVLPGFVDTHKHLWQTQLRTQSSDQVFFDYYCNVRLISSVFYSPDDVRLGNYVGALEALNSGITTVVDHSHIIKSPAHADEAVRGLDDAGIRAIWCYGLYVYPVSHGPLAMPEDSSWRYEDVRRLRKGRFADNEGLVQLGLAPAEAEAMPFQQAIEEIRLARSLQLKKISCHVAMGPYSSGVDFVQKLGDRGLLERDILIAHGNSLSDAELAMMSGAGCGISSTPETEMQMAIGFSGIRRALDANVPASLGADTTAVCAGDMFAQMRLMLQTTRALDNQDFVDRHGRVPTEVSMKSIEALRLATAGGADVAGLADRVGVLAVGKEADIVLIRTDSPNMVPATDPASAVVLYANPGDVDTVIVAGRLRKRNGKLVGVDWPKLVREIERSRDRILEAQRQVDLDEVVSHVRRAWGMG